jgi:hypothetical protein
LTPPRLPSSIGFSDPLASKEEEAPMTAEARGRVVDADGHVLEPADTWLKYLEPSYRDRAIRIGRDHEGYEVLLIDGRPLKTLRGQLGALGGIDMEAARLLTRGQVTYAEASPPGGYDPNARLRVDAEGIDSALLYPTIGICWEGHALLQAGRLRA